MYIPSSLIKNEIKEEVDMQKDQELDNVPDIKHVDQVMPKYTTLLNLNGYFMINNFCNSNK
jgi:hypothetical protein